MHLIKSTKIIIASVALMLAAATVAFAYGASQGRPTLVVHEASDLLGGSTAEPPPVATTKPTPAPEKTTFTTSYPEKRPTAEATAKAKKAKAKAARAAVPEAKASTPAPSSSAPSPQPSSTPTPDPVTWLVRTLVSGF